MARSQIDLHTHTTASDGTLTPAQLVRLAAEEGLRVLAITDHDSTASLEEAMQEAQQWGLEIIPGVEINTDIPQGEIHILGYFIDYQDKKFQSELARLRAGRVERGQAMVEKLRALGAPIRWERVQELAGGEVVARPHVAQALVESGFVPTYQEAFDKYIGRNGPAYVERLRLSPEGAAKLILQAKGVPVLAHPYLYDRAGNRLDSLNLEQVLPSLCDAGLVGLEAYYAFYPPEATASLLELAQRFNLVATGGSDYHGRPNTFGDIGSVSVPPEAVEALRARRKAT